MFFIFLFHLVFSITTELSGDLSVSGKLNCEGLESDTFYSNGTLHTSESLTTTDITADEVSVSDITLSSIYPIDSSITIDANVIINAPSSSTSFIEIKWQLFSHEDFESLSLGWNSIRRNTCNDDFFLEVFANEEITKTYELPQHNVVRINASVHMIDDWQGETLYMKINDQIVWAENAKSGQINLCGGSQNDAGYGIPIDVIHKSKETSLKVTFGSTLQTKTASFGVDDMIVYLK